MEELKVLQGAERRRERVPFIAKMDVFPLVHALAQPDRYGSTKAWASHRTATLVRLTTDEGAIGWGECYGPPEPTTALLRTLAPEVVGRRADSISEFLMRCYSTNYHTSVAGIYSAALSGLDIAAWDAWARTLNVSVANLLGGRLRSSIQMYASTGYSRPDEDPERFRQEIRSAVAAGFKACKIRVGFGPKIDEQRVAYARQELGESRLLMVDYNANGTADLAIRSLDRLAPYDLTWAEEPLPPWDTAGWARLRQRTSVPLAAGEAACTRFEFKDLLCASVLDIVQPDLTFCGGISEASVVGHMAAAWNIRFSPHIWGGAIGQAASLQLLAALPVPSFGRVDPAPLVFEWDCGDNPLRDLLLIEPLEREHGHVKIPEGPGLGVVPDPAVLAEFALKEMPR